MRYINRHLSIYLSISHIWCLPTFRGYAPGRPPEPPMHSLYYDVQDSDDRCYSVTSNFDVWCRRAAEAVCRRYWTAWRRSSLRRLTTRPTSSLTSSKRSSTRTALLHISKSIQVNHVTRAHIFTWSSCLLSSFMASDSARTQWVQWSSWQSIGLVTKRLQVRLTPGPLQATLSKLLTYCVLKPTQPPTLSGTGNE